MISDLDQPEVTFYTLSARTREGDDVTLSCNATGNPLPTTSWTRNGCPLDKSSNSRISYSKNKEQLTITDLNRKDSGEYRCMANNSVGNVTSSAAILYVQCE